MGCCASQPAGVAAPEDERRPLAEDDFRDYVDQAALLFQLRRRNVRLVTPEFLIRHFRETGEPLPSRQCMPDHGFLDVDELAPEEQRRLVVIAVSYCWVSKDHPDPDRYHLETLVRMLEIFTSSTYDSANERYEVGQGKPGKKYMRDGLGFLFGAGDGRPVGVFLDWTSLYQDKPQRRTEEQAKAFSEALKTINLWYAHQATTVWMLSCFPQGTPRAGYHESGWTTFERAVASLLTPSHKLLDVTADLRADLVSPGRGARHYVQLALDAMDRGRGVPQDPAHFNTAIAEKHFTNGADKEAVVKPKYATTFEAVIQDAPILSFVGCSFDGAACRRLLVLAARECGRLRCVDLSYNDVDLPLGEIAELIRPQTHLTGVNLGSNPRLAGDIACLAALARLTELELHHTAVAGDMACLAALKGLRKLNLGGCRVTGDIACLAALEDMTSLGLQGSGFWGDLTALAALKKMTALTLHETSVTGDIACLAALECLDMLRLGDSPVTGDVACLAALGELRELDLQSTGVTGDAASLAALSRLENVNLEGTGVLPAV